MADRHQAVAFDANWRTNLSAAVNAFYLPHDFEDSKVYGELQTAYDNWQGSGGTEGFEVHAVYDDATNVLVEIQLLAALNVQAGSDGIVFWSTNVPVQETLKGWVEAGMALSSVQSTEAAFTPEPPALPKPPATLEEAWTDHGWYAMFEDFCTSRQNTENLEFVNGVQAWQASPSAVGAWDLYDRFVTSGAPREINVDGSVVRAIEAALPNREMAGWQRGQVSTDVFDAAVRDCWGSLKETYREFRLAN